MIGTARAIPRREHLGNARSGGAGFGLGFPLPNDVCRIVVQVSAAI